MAVIISADKYWEYGRLKDRITYLKAENAKLREALEKLEHHDSHRDPEMVKIIAQKALAWKEEE